MMEAQLVLASWVHKLRFELSQTDTPAFEPLLTLRPRGGIRMHVVRRHQQQALLPAAAE
jgi:cytochrome P450